MAIILYGFNFATVNNTYSVKYILYVIYECMCIYAYMRVYIYIYILLFVGISFSVAPLLLFGVAPILFVSSDPPYHMEETFNLPPHLRSLH